MNFAIIFTILFNRCLADLCSGISYKKDFLPKSIDVNATETWTPIKEYANGEELCCLDPCCTGYVITWNNGSLVSRMIWNCTDFEECGAEPQIGFGTFLITREKNESSMTESSHRCPETTKSSKTIDETKNRTTKKNNETESLQKMEPDGKNSTTFAQKDECKALKYVRDEISEMLDVDALTDWKPIENFTDCVEICCEDPCCTGYGFVYHDGSWRCSLQKQCNTKEECKLIARQGFGTIFIQRVEVAEKKKCAESTTNSKPSHKNTPEVGSSLEGSATKLNFSALFLFVIGVSALICANGV